MNEDIVVPIAFFVMVCVLSLGIPLVRHYIKRAERQPALSNTDRADDSARLARIEAAVESMSIELERISEGQRFVTKLLAGRAEPVKLPSAQQ
jgi:hypothetical protein